MVEKTTELTKVARGTNLTRVCGYSFIHSFMSKECKHQIKKRGNTMLKFLKWYVHKRNPVSEGLVTPRVLVKRYSHTDRENPQTPVPYTKNHSLHESGQLLTICFDVDESWDFFNPNLKFTPTGSQTQDLSRYYWVLTMWFGADEGIF